MPLSSLNLPILIFFQVTSRKDQAQYWADPSKPYEFIPVSAIAEAFKNSRFGKSVHSALSNPYDKSKSHPTALSKTKYAVSRWELLKTCFARELLLIGRHRFLYTFRTCQVLLGRTCFFFLTKYFFMNFQEIFSNGTFRCLPSARTVQV